MSPLQAALPLVIPEQPADTLTTRLANLERARSSYIAQLDGTKPTRLSPQTLRDDIHRVTLRIAELSAQLQASA